MAPTLAPKWTKALDARAKQRETVLGGPVRIGRTAERCVSDSARRRGSLCALTMADSGNPRKIGESPKVGTDYRSIGGSGGRGDQEIVSTTRAARLADCGEQLGVLDSDADIVGDDRQ